MTLRDFLRTHKVELASLLDIEIGQRSADGVVVNLAQEVGDGGSWFEITAYVPTFGHSDA